MPRIRTIKPEFWSDEKLSFLSVTDRLVFLALISMSDDFGRVHDNVKVIDAFVFPNTSETVRESLANLSRIGRISRGCSSNGMAIIEIVNWDKHQKVDKPQPRCALPQIVEKTQEKQPFANDSRISRELVANDSDVVRDLTTDLGPPTTDLGSGIGDQGSGKGASAPPRTNRKFVPPNLEEAKAYAIEAAITLDVELFFDHYAAQGWVQSNGRALKDWRAAMRKWARRDAVSQSPRLSTPTTNRQPKTFAQQREANTNAAFAEVFGNGGA